MDEKTKENILTRESMDDDEFRAGQIAALAIVLGDVVMLLGELGGMQELDELLSSTEESITNNDKISRERMAGFCLVLDHLKGSLELGKEFGKKAE